jgi:hypothetical protein
MRKLKLTGLKTVLKMQTPRAPRMQAPGTPVPAPQPQLSNREKILIHMRRQAQLQRGGSNK